MKHHHLNVRTSDQEHAAIKRLAESSGFTISEYVRRCCLNENDRPVISTDISLLQNIYRNIRHAGGNLNQVARWMNSHSSNSEALEAQLSQALAANEEASSALADFIAAVKASI